MARGRLQVFAVVIALGHAREVRLATWNLEWFCDHDPSEDPSVSGRGHAAPSAALFQERVAAMAEAIAALRPILLALQEEVILMGVRWHVAYPLSYRHIEELMAERGVSVDHATLRRWVVKYSPLLEVAFHRRKRPVWVSWRMDETSVRVQGQWYYLYCAVDKEGQTIDFLLTAPLCLIFCYL